MPAKPMWLLRLPEIVLELSALEIPVVDRAVFERVFHVRRRRAIQLLHRFGGYQSGKTFLIEREPLVKQLTALQETGEFLGESARRTRLTEHLDQLRRQYKAAKVSIPVSVDVVNSKIAELPEGISLGPGRLQVDFESPEDLLVKLLTLAQSAANDFDRFCRMAELSMHAAPARNPV